ncbi:DUF1707 domain-containing protein [Nocardia sp. NPDC050710]|uniref:DUF1707 SHOCT-like domain-containing protein n=1 Tax=Nocardia sp. NPDC050710 TaxID=3157220 RepID=UPI0033F70348
MANLPDSRVSVADRERALRELSQHLGAGRLDVIEFHERSAKAAIADTRVELAELFADLPGAIPTPPIQVTRAWSPHAVFAVITGALALTLAVASREWLWLCVLAAVPVILVIGRRAG